MSDPYQEALAAAGDAATLATLTITNPDKLLNIACVNDRLSIGQLMIDRGFVLNLNFALVLASRAGYEDMVNLAITNGATKKGKGLRGACRTSNPGVVNQLIGLGGLTEHDFSVGVVEAAQSGNNVLVNLMIKNGATSASQEKAYCEACFRGYSVVVTNLIAKGATNHDAAFWYACEGGHEDCAKKAEKKGVSVNALNTGLSKACQNAHYDLTAFAISKGATECYYCHIPVGSHP